MKPSVWSLAYSDGSANAYRFVSDGDSVVFEYDPITPKTSSTGTYSGGDPRSGTLDAQTVESLWSHVRALESDAALHVEDRNKGTGSFSIPDATGTRSFIIERGPALAIFDAFVKSLG